MKWKLVDARMPLKGRSKRKTFANNLSPSVVFRSVRFGDERSTVHWLSLFRFRDLCHRIVDCDFSLFGETIPNSLP
jgi:hypothetical protein